MEQQPNLGTVDKALDILFELHQAAEPQSLTALGRALDMPKSSVHRLLAALMRRGLVEQDERGRYRTGIALIALGLGALEREPVAVAARPVLEQAAAELGETFFLVAARASQLVVLDKAEGSGFLRAAPRAGATLPLHATAVGKLYLAFAPEAIAAPDGILGAFTARTLTDATALAQTVNRAREQGWASNRDEWIAGLSVLAAPIFYRGRMLAAVALAMVSARFDSLGIDLLAAQVTGAAARIAQRLEVSNESVDRRPHRGRERREDLGARSWFAVWRWGI
ncbi:MAG: IclR family transcriptional regulator [Gammaproteobacteria bacterium]